MSRRLFVTVAATVVAVALSGPASAAGDILIRGAKVHTATAKGALEDTDVLVRNGRIAAVTRGGAVPAGVTVVEAKGRALTPGLFAGLTQIGLAEISAEESTVDGSLNLKAPTWEQRWRPEFDVTLAYNARSTVVPVARIEGLTWTVLAPGPGDAILAGQGGAVALDGALVLPSQAVLDGSRSLFVELGSAGQQFSGGSRAGQYMLLDQAIAETRANAAPGADALLHPAGRAALTRFLDGGRVVFEVERAADILAVLAFAERYRIKAVISGGSEAWLVADRLARARVPVVLNSLQDLPGDFDTLSSRLDNAARLQKAGVVIAFSNGDSHMARNVRQLAGNAVAHGLGWDAALAALTASPADIFGIADRGRIEPGKVADLVLWDGDPLEVTSAADAVWIGGQAMPMRSRQTELRDRYMPKRAR